MHTNRISPARKILLSLLAALGLAQLGLLKPQGKLLRRLERDAADAAGSKIVQQRLGRLVQIEAAAGSDGTAPARHSRQSRRSGQS